MAEHHDDVREPGDKLPGRMYPAVGGSGEIAETAGGRLEAYHRWPGWPEDEGDPPMIVTHHAVGQSPDFYQKIKPSLAEALVEMEEKNPMLLSRLSGMPMEIHAGERNAVITPRQHLHEAPTPPAIEISRESPHISERELEIYERYYHAYTHMERGHNSDDKAESAHEYLHASYRLQEGRDIARLPDRVGPDAGRLEIDANMQNASGQLSMSQKLAAIANEIKRSDLADDQQEKMLNRITEVAAKNGYAVEEQSQSQDMQHER